MLLIFPSPDRLRVLRFGARHPPLPQVESAVNAYDRVMYFQIILWSIPQRQERTKFQSAIHAP